jgi:hypothetical protein
MKIEMTDELSKKIREIKKEYWETENIILPDDIAKHIASFRLDAEKSLTKLKEEKK